MGTTTFSGPIKAGPIKSTTGTTVGSDVANVGYTTMVQQQEVDIAALGAATLDSAIVIPANSSIVNVFISRNAAFTGSATSISVGVTGGSGTQFITSQAMGTTNSGLVTMANAVTNTINWRDVGASDVRVSVTSSAAPTAGVLVLTIMYAQASNAVATP
jgi:hypothetical protein